MDTKLQSQIQYSVSPWKSGKFMPMTLRPYSANTFALSKAWFKCNSVNTRLSDINTINIQVKSLRYKDCF